jgi:hypothetical protein
MFSLEPPEGEEEEGTSDKNPIRLHYQNLFHMECFLSILYPMCAPSNLHDILRSHRFLLSTFEEEHDDSAFWYSCFCFAYKWEFSPQQHVAMNKLTKLDHPLYMIAVGRLREMDAEFLAPYFAKLLDRPLTSEEGQTLGSEDLIRLNNIQHYLRVFCINPPHSTCVHYATAILDDTKPGNEEAFMEWMRINHPRCLASLQRRTKRRYDYDYDSSGPE